MSKKKAMPRATMTLKDFHGGNIPSDLQLPSAPGMTADRNERPGSNVWTNNPMNRSSYGGDRNYHRQGPINGIRTYEDKPSYFPNPANIGRNYDEDERRPLDYRPRSSEEYRSSSGNSISRMSSFPNDRMQYMSNTIGRFGSQQSLVEAPRTPPPRTPPENAWAARREADQVRVQPVRNNMARLAEASAIDKVSSGRWQPGFRGVESDFKKEAPYENESRRVETLQITHEEFRGEKYVEQEKVQYEPAPWRSRSAERGAEFTGYRGEYHEKVAVPTLHGGDVDGRYIFDREPYRRYDGYQDERYRGVEHHGTYDRLEVQHDDRYNEGFNNRSEYRNANIHTVDREIFDARRPQRQGSFEYSVHELNQPSADSGRSATALHRSNSGERPKLKLLPRKRSDQDSTEQFEEEDRGRYQEKVGQETNADLDRETLERPKLNLKPRSQVVEDAAGSEKERQSLFGGARPRELVLKERGIEDTVEAAPSDVNRVEIDTVRSEKKDRRSQLDSRQGNNRNNYEGGKPFNNRRDESDRYENRREPLDRYENRRESSAYENRREASDRYDHRRESSGYENRRESSDRYDNRREQSDRYESNNNNRFEGRGRHQDSKRDIDKQESWRRPVDSPPPAVSGLADLPASRGPSTKAYGGSSAMQLAQAFSRSANISRNAANSRLMDTPSPRYNNNNMNSYNNNRSSYRAASTNRAW